MVIPLDNSRVFNMEIDILGKKVEYVEMYFERDLKNVFDDLVKEEGFKFGNPETVDDLVYRLTEPGKKTGIHTGYKRKLEADYGNINNWYDVNELIEFFKGNNHARFTKGKYNAVFEFECTRDEIKKAINSVRDRFKEIKKPISFELETRNNFGLVKFSNSLNIMDEIYFTYSVLRDFLTSKGL